MKKLGHWLQCNVPAKQLFLWRARLSFVVWVPHFSHVTFSYRLKEGIWVNLLKTQWSEMNVRNWSTLIVAMQLKLWQTTCRKKFWTIFSAFTKNFMKGLTFSYRFKGSWVILIQIQWFKMKVRNWSSLTVAMQMKQWRRTFREYF